MIICSYYTTKYAKLPKNCDVSFAIGELHQVESIRIQRGGIHQLQNIDTGRSERFGSRNQQVSYNRPCGKGESRHQLVWCQDPRQRKSPKDKATQGINLHTWGGQLYQQRRGSLQPTNDVWPYFCHMLIVNITWPYAWWSSPLANEALQLGTICVSGCVIWTQLTKLIQPDERLQTVAWGKSCISVSETVRRYTNTHCVLMVAVWLRTCMLDSSVQSLQPPRDCTRLALVRRKTLASCRIAGISGLPTVQEDSSLTIRSGEQNVYLLQFSKHYTVIRKKVLHFVFP